MGIYETSERHLGGTWKHVVSSWQDGEIAVLLFRHLGGSRRHLEGFLDAYRKLLEAFWEFLARCRGRCLAL